MKKISKAESGARDADKEAHKPQTVQRDAPERVQPQVSGYDYYADVAKRHRDAKRREELAYARECKEDPFKKLIDAETDPEKRFIYGCTARREEIEEDRIGLYEEAQFCVEQASDLLDRFMLPPTEGR